MSNVNSFNDRIKIKLVLIKINTLSWKAIHLIIVPNYDELEIAWYKYESSNQIWTDHIS